MSELVTEVHRVCSWCRLQFASESWKLARADQITTWGVCPDCLEQLRAACMQRRRQKRAAGLRQPAAAPTRAGR